MDLLNGKTLAYTPDEEDFHYAIRKLSLDEESEVSLDDVLSCQVLKKLALWLRTIHESDVWQRDFKSSNILCRNSDFFMVDLDGVRIRRLSEENKITNLAQLNASVSKALTIKDRLRFYHYYAADLRPTRRQRRAVFRKVWEIAKTKNTKIYEKEKRKIETSSLYFSFLG